MRAGRRCYKILSGMCWQVRPLNVLCQPFWTYHNNSTQIPFFLFPKRWRSSKWVNVLDMFACARCGWSISQSIRDRPDCLETKRFFMRKPLHSWQNESPDGSLRSPWMVIFSGDGGGGDAVADPRGSDYARGGHLRQRS